LLVPLSLFKEDTDVTVRFETTISFIGPKVGRGFHLPVANCIWPNYDPDPDGKGRAILLLVDKTDSLRWVILLSFLSD
jgi:hypothetical protein